MAKERIPKTIYFIRSIQATAEELAEIEALGPGVVIRSAMRTHPGEAIEPFDKVAGTVPEHYAKADGKPKEFLTKRAKKIARAAADRGDEAPPEKRAKAAPQRRAAAKAAALPSAPETGAAGPQAGTGAGWGNPPAAAPGAAPTPPAAPPVWKPNA